MAIALAREKKLFLMEAVWTRFFPAMEKVREWLAAGLIGEVRLLEADFGIVVPWHAEGRHFSLAEGGGALLDVGIYCVSLSSLLFGSPTCIASDAMLGSTGVDEQCGMVLRHAGGQMSSLLASFRADTHKGATIYGGAGRIEIHATFWKPSHLSLVTASEQTQEIALPYPNFGYQFEAAHVMDCLRRGQLEQPDVTGRNAVRAADAGRDPRAVEPRLFWGRSGIWRRVSR